MPSASPFIIVRNQAVTERGESMLTEPRIGIGYRLRLTLRALQLERTVRLQVVSAEKNGKLLSVQSPRLRFECRDNEKK